MIHTRTQHHEAMTLLSYAAFTAPAALSYALYLVRNYKPTNTTTENQQETTTNEKAD